MIIIVKYVYVCRTLFNGGWASDDIFQQVTGQWCLSKMGLGLSGVPRKFLVVLKQGSAGHKVSLADRKLHAGWLFHTLCYPDELFWLLETFTKPGNILNGLTFWGVCIEFGSIFLQF